MENLFSTTLITLRIQQPGHSHQTQAQHNRVAWILWCLLQCDLCLFRTSQRSGACVFYSSSIGISATFSTIPPARTTPIKTSGLRGRAWTTVLPLFPPPRPFHYDTPKHCLYLLRSNAWLAAGSLELNHW